MVRIAFDFAPIASPPPRVGDEVGWVGEDHVETFGLKLWKDFPAVTVIQGDAIIFEIRFR